MEVNLGKELGKRASPRGITDHTVHRGMPLRERGRGLVMLCRVGQGGVGEGGGEYIIYIQASLFLLGKLVDL